MWLHVPNLDVCTSAQDTEDSSLPSDLQESHAEPYVTLSGIPTQRPISWRGWQRRTWIALLSGTISRPSIANRGADEWIASLPVSHANHLALRETRTELTTNAGSGLPSSGSFVTWDQDLFSWKTSPDLFGEVCHSSSVILPTSGSMRNGACSARPRLAHHTNASASGSWPTPRASMNENRNTKNAPSHGVSHGETLAGLVSNWATPVANDDHKSPEAHIAMKQRLLGRKPTAAVTSLTVQVKMWPTPAAHDPKDLAVPPSQVDRNSQMLPVAAVLHGLQGETETGENISLKADLSPRFVEALMGLPSGWLTPSIWVGTDSFQQWLRQHSLSYTED
jgi:hypothetical protein